MSKLSKKIIILYIMIALPISIINILAFQMYKSSSFKVPASKNILVLGDSHTEYGINDKIIKNCVNVSNSAEAYLYSYIKLKTFIKDNPKINTVLLSFHYRSLSKKLDSWIVDPEYMLGRMPPYLPFISKREWEVAILPNILLFTQNSTKLNLKFIIKNLGRANITFHDLKIGGYKKLHRMKLKEDIIKKKNSKITPLEISELQVEYLNKIINYCITENIRLVLISTPVFNAERFYNTNGMYDYYKKNLSHIAFIDTSNANIPKNGFSDISHLNATGSKIYSYLLRDILNDYLEPIDRKAPPNDNIHN